MKVFVSIKNISSRKAIVRQTAYDLINTPQTVGELIDEFVEICLKQYRNRTDSKEILRVLTKKEILDKSITGKIDFNKNRSSKLPSLDEAKKIAKESYQDGLVTIFIDGKEIGVKENSNVKDLEEKLEIKEESEILFIKMTFLVGRLW